LTGGEVALWYSVSPVDDQIGQDITERIIVLPDCDSKESCFLGGVWGENPSKLDIGLLLSADDVIHGATLNDDVVTRAVLLIALMFDEVLLLGLQVELIELTVHHSLVL
jgi:hypothetical protein